ncbi:MAG: transglutaminase domain-containing protein [Bacteroidota bacterium]
MQKFSIFWLLWVTASIVYASDTTSPFGQVTKAELSEAYYPLDSAADAVILRNNGKVRISYLEDKGFRAYYTREIKIKIYRSSGFDWADVALPYYVKDKYKAELVRDIEAFSYTLDGDAIQKTGLSKKDIFTEEANEAYSLKKFAFPNVREGSIMEYKYTLVSPYLFHLNDWEFRREIPVVWSEYEAIIPAFYEYQMLYRGYIPFEENDAEVYQKGLKLRGYTYSTVKYHWAVKGIPAFADESFVGNKDDYIAKLTFQLVKENFPGVAVRDYMNSWPELTKDLRFLTDYGKFLKRKDGKETVRQLTESLSSDTEKAQAIYNYLNKKLRWNGEISLYPDTSPKDLLKQQTGNSTDLNILLSNWLNIAGVEASPVLLSTRAHGRIQTKYPEINQFNYSVVRIEADGKEYLLDITEPAQPFGMIPIYCLNDQGLLVDSDEGRWISLERGDVYQIENYYTLEYQKAEDQFRTSVSQIFRGYGALTMRQMLRDQPKKVAGYTSDNFKVFDQDQLDKALRVAYTRQSDITQLGEYVYIETFPRVPVAENPFKAVERKHPIDYSYRRTYKQTFNIRIPEGYKVEELPQNLSFALEGNTVQFIFQTQVTAVSAQVVSLLRINHSLIAPEQYQQLRKLYEEMLVKHQEKIVLQKVKAE